MLQITAQTGFIPIPGTEIKITRTAFKDNSSFYTLNDKRVKFKEIAIILKKNGIDLVHNRFLILQVNCVKYLIKYFLCTKKYKYSFVNGSRAKLNKLL